MFNYQININRPFGMYEALSYRWGDPTGPRKIYIQNSGLATFRSLDVTKNLYAGLQRLRDPDLPRTVWIDAICINQEDLGERGQQVSFMTTIYANACQVVVWLGHSPEDNKTSRKQFKAFEAIKQTSSRAIESSEPKGKIPDTLCELLRNEWFSRVWILQEVAAARSLSILYNDEELPGAVFVSGMKEVIRQSEEGDSFYSRYVPFVVDLMARAPPTPSIHMASKTLCIAPLADLIEMFYDSNATDRRDKVYALLGLRSDYSSTDRLVPNYEKSWARVFSDLVEHILGSNTKSETLEDSEGAVLTATGCTIGFVASVGRDLIEVETRDVEFRIQWTLIVHSKEVIENDVVCLLKGSAHPTIIRPCGDHFDIIVVSLSSTPRIIHPSRTSGPIPTPALIPTLKQAWLSDHEVALRHDFLLIWDWQPINKQTSRHHHDWMAFYDRARRENTCPHVPESDIPWVRRLAIRRVLDDVQPNNKGKWEDFADLPICAEGANTATLYRRFLTVSSFMHHSSYTWLTSYVKDTRQAIRSLRKPHLSPTELSPDSTDLKVMIDAWAGQFRAKEGVLDLVELEDQVLSDARNFPNAHRSHNSPLYWDFGEPANAHVLNSIFPLFRQASLQPLQGDSIAPNGVFFNGRYVIKLLIKQERLDIRTAQSIMRNFDVPLTRLMPKISYSYDDTCSDHQPALIIAVLSEACGNLFLANEKMIETLKSLALGANGLVSLSFLYGELWYDHDVIRQILRTLFVPSTRIDGLRNLNKFLDYQGQNLPALLTKLNFRSIQAQPFLRQEALVTTLFEHMAKDPMEHLPDFRTVGGRAEARDRVRKWFMETQPLTPD